MGPHVNGWPVIQHRLKVLKIRQTGLAKLLNVSPPAITQFKQGASLLHAEQLQRMADFLQMDDAERTALYSQIFQARFALPGRPAERHFALSLAPGDAGFVPECRPEVIGGYEPAVEPMSRYLNRRNIVHAGRIRICWDEVSAPVFGLHGRGSFILECDAYPSPGDMVYLKCRDFSGRVCRLLEFTGGGGVFELDDKACPRLSIPFPQIAWLRPVTELD